MSPALFRRIRFIRVSEPSGRRRLLSSGPIRWPGTADPSWPRQQQVRGGRGPHHPPQDPRDTLPGNKTQPGRRWQLNLALAARKRTSQYSPLSAGEAESGRHGPLMAAMTGLRSAVRVYGCRSPRIAPSAFSSVLPRSSPSDSVLVAPPPERSAPAQKPRPAPVTTMTRTRPPCSASLISCR